MVFIGDNQFYVNGLRELLLGAPTTFILMPGIRRITHTYVLSGMTLTRIHQLLIKYPPPRFSAFIFNPRYLPVIQLMLAERDGLLIPEKVKPQELLQQLSCASGLPRNTALEGESIRHFSFTRTEIKIIRMIMKEKSIAETSAALNIHAKTYFSHRGNIMKKTGVASLQDFYALWRAIESGGALSRPCQNSPVKLSSRKEHGT